jgi:hypothetical protein
MRLQMHVNIGTGGVQDGQLLLQDRCNMPRVDHAQAFHQRLHGRLQDVDRVSISQNRMIR